ncbi:MAG: ABC transporter permease [Holophagales bacterium]|nr:ABC transporter permease [Holophagales bacterium]
MPDWRRLVRSRFPPIPVRPEREAEIVEELARLLEDYAGERSFDLGETDVDDFVETHIPEWTALARQVTLAERRTSRPLPPPSRGSHFMKHLIHDLRLACRMLTKSPMFASVAVLTLGIAIGFVVSVFSILDGLFFQPLPVAAPEELVMIHTFEEAKPAERMPVSYPDFLDLRESATGLARFGAAYYSMGVVDAGNSEGFAITEVVSGDYFRTLGVSATLGREISLRDDRTAAAVVVLSHASWQRRYGGSPEVLGQTLRLNGRPLTIVGVAPSGFGGLLRGLAPEMWIPMSLGEPLRAWPTTSEGERVRGVTLYQDRGYRWLRVVARLEPGVGREAAAAEISALAARLQEAHPATHGDLLFEARGPSAFAAFPSVDETIRGASAVLMSIVALVLLIASANIANMMLARSTGRRREIATRLAIGASRGQVVRQLLVESLVLAFLGGALGLGIAMVTVEVLDLGRWMQMELSFDLGLDYRAVFFTLLVSVMAAASSGLAPALATSRVDLASGLRDAGRAPFGRGGRRLQGALVVAQVATAMVLMVCAGLAVRSFDVAQRVDPGFETEGVVTARLAPSLQGYSRGEAEALYRSLIEGLESRPGVSVVTSSRRPPLVPWEFDTSEVSAADGAVPRQEWLRADITEVGPGYFETLKMPITAGRALDPSDTAASQRVAVINETLAARLWPKADAVGRRILLDSGSEEGSADYFVVGVARDAKYRSLGEVPRPFVYRSIDQFPAVSRVVMVRRAGSSATATAAMIRQQIREIDESLAVTSLGTLEEAVDGAYLVPHLTACLLTVLGLAGMVVACLGIYGVIAYSASQRVREIGIRMAIGAGRSNVVTLVARRGLALTALGLAVGICGALLGSQVLNAVLIGISATDPLTFIVVSLVFVIVAALACWIPADRAASADPLTALRHD